MNSLRLTCVCFIAVALLSVPLAGCAKTHQARKAEPSGFLGDYSQLKAGEKDRALLFYENPKAEFRKYRKVLVRPIQIYAKKDSSLAKVDRDDMQSLSIYLGSAVRGEVEKQYPLTNQPGADVMELRLAITDADSSAVVLDTITTVVPIGLALSAVKRVGQGSHTMVGSAQLEGELRDSLTGERLLAAVDKRSGTKAVSTSKFDKWHHSKDAFDRWAERIGIRLAELRTRR